MNPIGIVLGIILLAVILDVVLTLKWNRIYFTAGLPLFVRRVPKPGGIGELSLTELEEQSKTAGGMPLQFRRLDGDVIAFRDRVFGGVVHYIPIMHGVISYDATEGTARVIGLVNWFAVAFIVGFAVLLGRRAFLEILPFVAGVFGIIYFIQAVRYNRVAKKLM